MRRIGTLTDEARARQFANHLLGLGIACEVEAEDGRGFAVWVRDENQITQGGEELAAFQANPDEERFARTAQAGRQAWKRAAEQAKGDRSKPIDMRTTLARERGETLPAVTMALIGISVFVYYLQVGGVTEPGATERLLQISTTSSGLFPEVSRGEVWRLLTPMFLHGSLIHIIFNMMWTWDLGRVLEKTHGALMFVLLVLVFSLGGNVLQYLMVGPWFGGMSGVVFGLLGYMWMKTVWDPRVPYELPKSTVVLMAIWFLICWVGVVGNIANWGHTGGLLAGMAWGAASSPRFWKRLGIR